MRRHYQSCKSAQNVDKTSIEVSRRVNRACSTCRQSKVKCSGNQPCERCCSIGQNQLCQFAYRSIRLATTSDASTPDRHSASTTEETILSQEHLQQDRQDIPGSPLDSASDLPTANRALQELHNAQEISRPTEDELANDSLNTTRTSRPDPNRLEVPSANPLVDVFGTDDPDINFLDLDADMFFNLDPLDWGILDNSFVAHQADNDTGFATEDIANPQLISPEATSASPSNGEGGEQSGIPHLDLPPGMSLMQISPLEAHRSQIIRYLKETNQGSRRWDHWLSIENMSRFLRSYFRSFHQHTPLLHLPFWSISTVSTRLIFAMSLMGAMYSGDLKFNDYENRKLCQMAQAFAWSSDPRLRPGDPAQLDTIQAVYIVTLLEAFYFPYKSYRALVDTKKLVNEARNAGVFDIIPASTAQQDMKWHEWSVQECRIR